MPNLTVRVQCLTVETSSPCVPPFKVTQGHHQRHRSIGIYNFLLVVINRTMGTMGQSRIPFPT